MAKRETDYSGRIGVEACREQGRCLCAGCGACRGAPGYPCAWLVSDSKQGLCRYCRLSAPKGV